MPASAERSVGEYASHFSAIRIRVTGVGKLRLSIYSIDKLRSKLLVPLDMTVTARHSMNRLVNFVEQRASFTISTQDMGESFRINRILIFSKELYKSYPGS